MEINRLLNWIKQPEKLVFLTQLYTKGAAFLVFALVSRHMPPAEYAAFVIVFAIINTIVDLGNTGLMQGVLRYSSGQRGKVEDYPRISSTAIFSGIGIVAALVICIQIAVVTKALPEAFYAGNANLSVFLGFSVLMALMNALFTGYAFYFKYALSGFLNSSLLILIVAVFYFKENLSMLNLILAYSVAVSLCCVAQIYMLRKFIKITFDKKIFSEFLKVGKWYFLWAVLSNFENKMDLFILSSLAEKEQLAYYDIAGKYMQIIQLYFNSAALVLSTQAAAVAADNSLLVSLRRNVTDKIKKIQITNLLIVPFVVIFILLYYSGKYNEAVFSYLLLSFSYSIFILTLKPSVEIYRLNIPKLLIYVSVCTACVRFISCWVLIPIFSAAGASASVIIANLSSLMLMTYLVKKKNEKNN